MGLLLIPATVLVLGVGGTLAAALPVRGALERLVVALIVAQLLVTFTLLGAGVVLRELNVGGILIALVIVLTGALLFAWWAARPDGGLRDRASSAVTELAAMWRAATRSRVVLGLAIVAASALAWRFLLAVRLPVLDYDGFSYHLVTVDVWLQSGEIGRVPQRLWSDSYPENGELISLWLMAFSRNDALAALSGLVPLPLAGLSVAGLARRLGADRPWAAIAGLLFMLLPAVIALANTTYVDNLAAADLAAAWFLGLAATGVRPGRRRTALLIAAGFAIGLSVGTKASMLVPLAAFAVVLVAAALLGRGPAVDRIRKALQTAVLVGVPALLGGGYWYIRDIVLFGNPVWPFTIGPFRGVGTVDQLIGQHPAELAGMSQLRQVLTSWLRDFHLTSYAYDTRIGGYGIGWLAVLGIGLIGFLLLIRARRYLPVIGMAIPAAVIVAILPEQWWARYTFFLPIIALAMAAVALSRMPPRAALVLGAVVIAASLVSLGVVSRRSNLAASATGSRPSIGQLLRLVATGPGNRAQFGLWAECAGFSTIPPGAMVSTDSFNLLHLVIGHDLDRTLGANIGQTADSATLLTEASAANANYLVLVDSTSIEAAQSDPAAFVDLGPVCRGTRLFRLGTG